MDNGMDNFGSRPCLTVRAAITMAGRLLRGGDAQGRLEDGAGSQVCRLAATL